MWQADCDERFNQLKANEEKLNRIFIDIYGLQDEMTPEVEDKDVTVRKADPGRDIRAFISYAVGCMFGRYSIHENGLIYAGGDWNEKYGSYVEYGRRYAIMQKGVRPDYLMLVKFLGGNTEFDGFAPRGSLRIKMNGGGMNFPLPV